MKKILFNIDLYFSFLKISLKEIFIYRVDFIVGLISQLIVQLVSLIFVFIIFNNTKAVAGWDFHHILLLYGLTRIPIGIVGYCFDSLYDLGPKLIKNGDFDQILLRPVHPLISVIGSSNEFVAIMDLITGLIITIYELINLSIPITLILILKIIIFSIIGALIIGAINTIFSITSFWTYKSNEIIWTFYNVYKFSEYPISIYNNFIKILITVVLPFSFVAYFPTLNYLGINKYLMYLSPFICVMFWFIAVKVWNLALRKYSSTGS